MGTAKLSIDRPDAVAGRRCDLSIGETRDLEREEVSLARAQLSDAGERRARLELKLNERPRVLDQLDSERRIAAGPATRT